MDEFKALDQGDPPRDEAAKGDDGRGDAQEEAPRGRAVQVDPIKPVLKPPGTNCLNLKRDVLLSSFAFYFNLRRYRVEHSAPGAEKKEFRPARRDRIVAEVE